MQMTWLCLVTPTMQSRVDRNLREHRGNSWSSDQPWERPRPWSLAGSTTPIVENFQYLGRRSGKKTSIFRVGKAAEEFQSFCIMWMSNAIITAIYISGHSNNDVWTVMRRVGVELLSDMVAYRQASVVMHWVPEGGRRKKGKQKKSGDIHLKKNQDGCQLAWCLYQTDTPHSKTIQRWAATIIMIIGNHFPQLNSILCLFSCVAKCLIQLLGFLEKRVIQPT